MAETLLTCGLLRIDLTNQRLWREEEEVRLTPKALAVLMVLLEQAGHVVTKAELLHKAWPGTIVTEAALTVCIRELRQALGDDARTPQYIETVHRRGYRFIGQVVSGQHSVVSSHSSPAPSTQRPAPMLVGRDTELAQLHQLLARALNGERQLVFVTGEPGIGKTALLDAFVSAVHSPRSQKTDPQPLPLSPWLAHGQCIDHFGPGEAYLPLLSALGALGRGPERERLHMVLHQYAPTWLMQLPALLTPAEMAALQPQTFGATRERMLRELADALEALTTETLLVLVLEDLHWSDPSTLDALSFLARRRQAAKLLVLGSYRPMEVLGNGHPLRAITEDLQVHRHSVELSVPLLTEAAVAEYLAARAALPTLARQIHQRTSGNPLFMVNVVEDLLAQPRPYDHHSLLPLNVPTTIRQMIERHYEHLTPEEQRILQRASVAGMTFSAAALSSDERTTVADIEGCCESLSRREQFLHASGTRDWPDGTSAGQYRFRHALYQEAIYDRVTPSAQQQYHHQIGERLEQAYGEQASTIAAELAVHFERARDYPRAVQYHGLTGQGALRRNAPQEASLHLATAIELLNHLPASTERNQQELNLQMALGVTLMSAREYAAPEVERAYSRARILCEELENSPQVFPVLLGLVIYYAARGQLKIALSLSEHCFTLAQRLQEPALLLEAYRSIGYLLCHLGDNSAARFHLDHGLKLYDPQQHRRHAFLYGHEPGVFCLAYTAWVLWQLGYPDQAAKKMQAALSLARQIDHPFSLLGALNIAMVLSIFRREGAVMEVLQQEFSTVSLPQETPLSSAHGTLYQGWLFAQQSKTKEGIAKILQAVDFFSSVGFQLAWPTNLSLLAEAYYKDGQIDQGLTTIAEGLAAVEETGERMYEAELYRQKGMLALEARGWRLETSPSSLQAQIPSEVVQEEEGYFLKAIDIARQQSAKSWELRATMSLVRLRQHQARTHATRNTQHETNSLLEAHHMLSDVYTWFTEGFDTPDLLDAKALLEVLSK